MGYFGIFLLKNNRIQLSTIPAKSVSFSKFTEHFHRRSELVFVFYNCKMQTLKAGIPGYRWELGANVRNEGGYCFSKLELYNFKFLQGEKGGKGRKGEPVAQQCQVYSGVLLNGVCDWGRIKQTHDQSLTLLAMWQRVSALVGKGREG